MTKYRVYASGEIVHEDDFEEYDNILYGYMDDYYSVPVPDDVIDEGDEAIEEYVQRYYL